jgi:signal transduction histidine kinase
VIRLAFFLSIFFAFIASFSYGQTILTDHTERLVIGKNLSVLEVEKELSFKEVVTSADFKKNDKDIPNLGLSAYSVWLKFSVTNNSSKNHFLFNVAYPILDEVEFFVPEDTGYRSISMGEIFPYQHRKYKIPVYVFDLDIPSGNTLTYYLRIKSAEQIIVPLSVSEPTNLWEDQSLENLISGIYFGVVLIMFFYNLFLFFSVRDRSYLYYVFYVLFAGLTQIGIKGYTYKYLWPSMPEFQLKSVIIFACISCLAAILFTRKFLLTQKNAPKSDKALIVLVVLFLLGIGCTIAGKTQAGFQVMQMSTSLFSFGVLGISFMVMIKGFEPARYFFAAWSVLLAGSIVFLLKDYGVLPYNALTSYAMQAASAVEMALLSFGLANSINILKREKEAEQLKALAAARENELIIKEQNVMLEEKVAERTAELKETNEDLNITLEDLKQAQSQLVEAEKMASLGQLTAGIAHEINNPINFVTSNVAPLKRDVKMIFDTIEFIEKIGFEEISSEEKKKRIHDFKEDLDYDYLKIEVDHLLNGIYEGSSRTAEIVKGLRIFSRVDENDLKKADMNEGIDSTLIIVNNLLNSSIQVVKDYADPMPLIECYPGKLNQVFLNIITNGIYAIRKKHGDSTTGVLTIRTRANDEYVTIEFIDNGTGMDETTQHKIYEPFFTTKDVGEGTGLGMSIVYNTIKKHNGTIQLVSTLGEGTSFLIQLPIIMIDQQTVITK